MSSAKAALESDTRVLAYEAGRKHAIRVNAISAGMRINNINLIYVLDQGQVSCLLLVIIVWFHTMRCQYPHQEYCSEPLWKALRNT